MLRLVRKDPRWVSIGADSSKVAFENKHLPAPMNRLVIHFHGGNKSYDPKTLRDLLDQICWTEDSLRQMKAIK